MNGPDTTMTIEIEGKRYTCVPADWTELDCIEVQPDMFHLLSGGKSHHIQVLSFDRANRTCVLRVDGEVKHVRLIRELDLQIERMGLQLVRDSKQQSLTAQMPGLVTAIKVAEGDTLEKGAPVLILEAMKMENVITAPHDTVVKHILVSQGQAVEKGAVLVEFE